MLKYSVILTISALTLVSLFFFTPSVSADLTPTYNQSIDQEITIGQNSASSVVIQIYPSNAQEDFTVTFDKPVVDGTPTDFEVIPISPKTIHPDQNPSYVYMTVAAGSNTPTGTYLVHVTSRSTLNGHETTRTNTVSVHVVSPDAFFLSASPTSVTIPQGGSSIANIVTTAKKTLQHEILLNTWSDDLGVQGRFSGAGEVANYGNKGGWGVHPISGSSLISSLEISVGPNTPLGTHNIWVTGETTTQDPNVSSSTNFYRHTILITVNVTPSTTETMPQQSYLIPSWVRNNAKYWSEGQISDSDFASGIGYLVTNGIIQTNTKGIGGLTVTVPEDMQIPSWIKNNAKYWSTGDIDDGAFLKGIQYMLDNDIITFSSHAVVKTNPPTTSTPQVTTTSPNDNQPQQIVQLILPQIIVQEATGLTGATVNFDASESSGGTPTCNPASGTVFPIGSTTVKCTVVDSVGSNPVGGSFTVTVQDTTPPVISPFAPHNDTPDDTGAVVYFTISAVDLVDGSVTPHCNYDSGTKFPLGVSTITCTATDSHGNTSTRSLQISITKS